MAEYLNLRPSAASDPIRNFRFLVTFTPLEGGSLPVPINKAPLVNMGFMAVQGLAAQTETIPYREGGMNTTPHQLPGQQSFSPVTFQKGVVLGSMFGWEWFRSLYDPGTAGTETVVGDFRCQGLIRVLKHPATHNASFATQLDASANVAASFTLLNAWPSNIAYSDLNAADNAVLVEQITVVHEGLVPAVSPS